MKKLVVLVGLLIPLSMNAWWWQKEAPKPAEKPQEWYDKMFCPEGQLSIEEQCAYMPDLEPIGD